jgi:hypothetical protein
MSTDGLPHQVALVAAYDLGKAIVGLRVDAVDGVPAEALAYDEEVATTALHNLAAYLTRKHPDVLAAMEASGLDVADMGRKCLNVARNLKARNIVHVPNATLTPDASSSAVSGSSAPRGPRVLDEVSSSEVSSSEVSSSEALRGAPRHSEVSSSEVSSSEVSSSEALRGAPRYSEALRTRWVLDDETLRAIEGGLEDAEILPAISNEARARLVIRKHLAQRIAAGRTRTRMQLKSRTARLHRLKRVADGRDAEVPQLGRLPSMDDAEPPSPDEMRSPPDEMRSPPDEMRSRALRYHLCLSHQWRFGQDVARAIKLRLPDFVPTIQICVELDKERSADALRDSIDVSLTVVVLISDGYFASIG